MTNTNPSRRNALRSALAAPLAAMTLPSWLTFGSEVAVPEVAKPLTKKEMIATGRLRIYDLLEHVELSDDYRELRWGNYEPKLYLCGGQGSKSLPGDAVIVDDFIWGRTPYEGGSFGHYHFVMYSASFPSVNRNAIPMTRIKMFYYESSEFCVKIGESARAELKRKGCIFNE